MKKILKSIILIFGMIMLISVFFAPAVSNAEEVTVLGILNDQGDKYSSTYI